MSDRQRDLTELEKKTRDRFVSEYLEDYSAVDACIRMGYSEAFAREYSRQFLAETYVLNKIKEEQAQLGITTEEDVHRKKIVSALYRESNCRGNSGSARVAALSQLCRVTGIEAPVKTQVTVDDGTKALENLTVEELQQLHSLMQKAKTNE